MLRKVGTDVRQVTSQSRLTRSNIDAELGGPYKRKVKANGNDAYGRSDACTEDVRLTVCRAPYNIKVVKRPESSFFRTLRTKLMWGNDVRIEN